LKESIHTLLQETIQLHLYPQAQVTRIEPVLMGADERGWSGSQIQRYRVVLQQNGTVTLITKRMPLKERRVMNLLTQQGHAHTPFTHSPDLSTEGLGLACMQDLGRDKIGIPNEEAPPSALSTWDEPVAQALAAIHARNLGQQAELSWLPRADEAYTQDFLVKEVWRAHWDKALSTHAAFAREFAAYTPHLEKAADQLIRAIAALWQENASLTLTHGEVHGEHVILYQSRPYFIDWGWAYYGPCYLDLPAYFTPRTVHHYRAALAAQGLEIREADFMERFREVGRYVGFKYLCSGIWLWEPGPTAERGRRILLTIQWAIDGTWSERAFAVPPRAWSRLLSQHTAFLSTLET
jgi:hypothetical protein